MESKFLLVATFVSFVGSVFHPNYEPINKNKESNVRLEAKEYLKELKEENEVLLENLNNKNGKEIYRQGTTR